MLSAFVLLTSVAAAPVERGAPEDAGSSGEASRFHWSVPGVLEVLSVPGETWAEGTPVQLKVYRSREKPEALLKDFVRAATARGLHLPSREQLPTPLTEATVTAFDPRTKISYTVMLQPEGKSVGVIVAEADLGRRQAGRGDFFVPLPPGATHPLQTRSEGAETLSFDLPRSGADPLAFYGSELLRAGFQRPEPNVFRRGDQELLIRLLEPRSGSTTRGVVVIRRAAAPTPEQFLKAGN